MLENGILYPVLPERANHMKLIAYASNDNAQTGFKKQLGVGLGGRLSAFRENFSIELISEIIESNAKRVIFSNEHCHSRLML